MDSKFAQIPTHMDSKFAQIPTHMDSKFAQIPTHMDSKFAQIPTHMDSKFAQIPTHMDSKFAQIPTHMDSKFAQIPTHMDSNLHKFLHIWTANNAVHSDQNSRIGDQKLWYATIFPRAFAICDKKNFQVVARNFYFDTHETYNLRWQQ